jgi:hypothetical protein
MMYAVACEMTRVKLGDKIRILDTTLTVIRIRKDALKRLGRLPGRLRNMVLDEAVKTLEDFMG